MRFPQLLRPTWIIVSKPTGLIALRLPRFAASMYSRQSLYAHDLTNGAIGVGADGRCKTSAHKEYPPDFCNAPAGTLIDEIARHNVSGDCPKYSAGQSATPVGCLTTKAVNSLFPIRCNGSKDFPFKPQHEKPLGWAKSVDMQRLQMVNENSHENGCRRQKMGKRSQHLWV